jgi:hypothetical protein
MPYSQVPLAHGHRERGKSFLLVTPDWLACLANALGVSSQDLVSKWTFFIQMDGESALSHVFQMITWSPACVMNTRYWMWKKKIASRVIGVFFFDGKFYDVAKVAIVHLERFSRNLAIFEIPVKVIFFSCILLYFDFILIMSKFGD